VPDETPPYRPYRSSFGAAAGVERQSAVPVDQDQDQASIPLPATDTAATGKTRSKSAATTADFTGPLTPAQFKLPQDLVQSLKLHSISDGKSMSEIVLECLTSDRFIGKAWVSTRRAA
jgi:hypothetical protein